MAGSSGFPVALYLQILADEINEKTPHRVTVFSWREYSRPKTRLKLAKKTSDLDSVVRQIQWLGLQHGHLRGASASRNARPADQLARFPPLLQTARYPARRASGPAAQPVVAERNGTMRPGAGVAPRPQLGADGVRGRARRGKAPAGNDARSSGDSHQAPPTPSKRHFKRKSKRWINNNIRFATIVGTVRRETIRRKTKR